jgi:hypothetical protein
MSFHIGMNEWRDGKRKCWQIPSKSLIAWAIAHSHNVSSLTVGNQPRGRT